MSSITVGDKVRVNIPNDGQFDFSNLEQFNGTEQKVSDIVTVFKRGKKQGSYTKLEGVSSEFGVPFAFMNEWLSKV